MDDVARKANLSRPLIYLKFKSKQDLSIAKRKIVTSVDIDDVGPVTDKADDISAGTTKLSEEELRFLFQGRNLAFLATLSKDGPPHVTPVWAEMVAAAGIGPTELDNKFIKLLDEAYICFLLGLYYSTVSLSSVATERLCYDILESSKINLDDTELDNKQKKAFFKIPYTALVGLLNECDLITDRIANDMKKINDLRQKYVHPLLEGDSKEDAKHSINLYVK